MTISIGAVLFICVLVGVPAFFSVRRAEKTEAAKKEKYGEKKHRCWRCRQMIWPCDIDSYSDNLNIIGEDDITYVCKECVAKGKFR